MDTTVLSLSDAHRNGAKYQLYGWSSPTETIESQYGALPAIDWLARERDRIVADPKRKAVIAYDGRGHFALFVNQVADDAP
jgi:hypothetical protein